MEFSFSLLQTAIAGLFALLVFSYLIKTSKSKRAPKVEGGWPLLGHLQVFAGPEPPHVKLTALAEKYGPVFTINIGVHSALVINTWEAAKECFTTNDLAVSSRPSTVGTKHLGYNLAMFGFSPYGPFWREMRKMTALELLSNRRLELLKSVRVSEVEMSLKQLYTCKKEAVEMKQWFGDLSLNVIFRMVAGKRYFNVVNGSIDDQKAARRWQKVSKEFFRLLGIFVLGDAVPWLSWLDVGGHEKAMKSTAEELDAIVTECLEEHKQRRAKGGRDQRDFMDVMLSVYDDQADIVGFDVDTVIKATCLSLVIGGSDTTMVTLTWALSLLLNNRHVLKKVYEELDEHVGRERLLKESDIDNLVYLQATVKEVMRLSPGGPLAGNRQFTEDCVVGGYHVPKGTWLLINQWKIQTDPRVWADPLEFKPDRFLKENRDVDLRGQHFELMPFGSGRRACPGITFALQMTMLTLAGFLHAFEVSTPENAPVDMTGTTGMTNVKLTPLDVLLKPRLSPNAYE